MLVGTFADLHQMRLMINSAASKYDAGEDIRWKSYMCKYIGDRKAFEAADRCMQMFGGVGLTTDFPIEKLWRDSRSFMITEGPEEILKHALQLHVLNQYG